MTARNELSAVLTISVSNFRESPAACPYVVQSALTKKPSSVEYMSAVSLRIIPLACASMIACQSPAPSKSTSPREIHTPTYDLLLPAEQKALLILFPCFPCDAADTRAESRIADRGTACYL